MNHTCNPLVRNAAVALTLALAAFLTWSVTGDDNTIHARPSASAKSGTTVR